MPRNSADRRKIRDFIASGSVASLRAKKDELQKSGNIRWQEGYIDYLQSLLPSNDHDLQMIRGHREACQVYKNIQEQLRQYQRNTRDPNWVRKYWTGPAVSFRLGHLYAANPKLSLVIPQTECAKLLLQDQRLFDQFMNLDLQDAISVRAFFIGTTPAPKIWEAYHATLPQKDAWKAEVTKIFAYYRTVDKDTLQTLQEMLDNLWDLTLTLSNNNKTTHFSAAASTPMLGTLYQMIFGSFKSSGITFFAEAQTSGYFQSLGMLPMVNMLLYIISYCIYNSCRSSTQADNIDWRKEPFNLISREQLNELRKQGVSRDQQAPSDIIRAASENIRLCKTSIEQQSKNTNLYFMIQTLIHGSTSVAAALMFYVLPTYVASQLPLPTWVSTTLTRLIMIGALSKVRSLENTLKITLDPPKHPLRTLPTNTH